MKYDFDEIIERNNTNAMKTDGYKEYLFPNNPNITINFDNNDLIQMWIADMEFATPDFIIDAVNKRLDKRIFGYSKIFDNEYFDLFNEWAKHYYDYQFDKNDHRTSLGIIPALYQLVKLICPNKDDKVVFLTPSYAHFKKACLYNNRDFITVPLLNNNNIIEIDYIKLEEALSKDDVKLFIFCNPYNPNGIMWSKQELTKISNIVKKYNKYIISDEIHCDLLRQNKKHIPIVKVLANYDRIITCMAPTKTFNLAGFMISNIIIKDKDIKKQWDDFNYMMDNPLSIEAAKSAYKYGKEWLEELKIYLDSNFAYLKSFLDNKLPLIKYEIPDATYLAWINLKPYLNINDDLTEYFAKEIGVLLESGTQFVDNGDGYIRLNLACPKTTLIKCLDKIYSLLIKK